MTLAGWAVWACALPQNNPPPDGGTEEGGTTGKGGSSTGGASGSATGGSATGGSSTGGTTGGTTTGGSDTGGTTTGGTTTGGTAGSTGGSMAGTATGGTMAGTASGGKGGSAGTTAGTTSGGKGGSAGTVGMGGTMAGTASGGKGGTAGTMGGGGSGPTVCPCLVHRYSFTGTNTTAADSIGTADGTITGGTQGGGVVTLSGTEQYVTLPTGILSGLTNATFEAWVTWTGGTTNWHRIFDFGNNAGDSGDQGTVAGNATAPYIFLTPRAGGSTATANCAGTGNVPRLAITGAGPSMESCVVGTAAFPAGSAANPTHVAVTVGSTMTLYINGTSVGMITPAVNLGAITDTHNWLGRSQFAPDGEYAGTMTEFRIYNTARSSAQIAASRTAGPDSAPAQ